MLNILITRLLLFPLSFILFFCRVGQCSDTHKVNSYAYILQAEELSEDKQEAAEILRNCNRKLITIDPFFTTNERWSKQDISRIRSGMNGRIVIAYISIGEAESYRGYWKKSWNNHKTAPSFIREENPDWPGNYKVSYWDINWQNIIIDEIEKIVSAGFDGVFLDIVDGFEYFEYAGEDGYIDNRINEETGASYRSDMIEFVRTIRNKLDSHSDKDYLIIPQNGTQLLESPIYQELISMQAVEDLFTNGNKLQSNVHSAYILNFLDSLVNQGKNVLLTEYPTEKKYIKVSKNAAKSHGFTLLITSRSLNKLGESFGSD